MSEEIEITLCCDGLQQAIEEGAVLVVPSPDAPDTAAGCVEGVLCEDGKTVLQINFCPFCGEKRG